MKTGEKKKTALFTKMPLIGSNGITAIRGQEEATYRLVISEVDFIRFPVTYKNDCLKKKEEKKN